jgi:antitoxin YefM
VISIRLDQDVRPLSQVRARVADYIADVCLTGRPLLVTQHGRGVVVIIDVREFEIMRQRLEQLEQEAASRERRPRDEGSPGV